MAPGHPPPGPGPSVPPPHSTTTTTGRERARARGGQGAGRDTPVRGHGSAQCDRQAPKGTGHRGRHNARARNHPRAKKGKGPGTGHRQRGHHGGHQDPHAKGVPRRRDQRPPNPSRRRTAPADAQPQHTLPKRESDAKRITPTHGHQPPETTQGMGGTPEGRTGYTHRGGHWKYRRAAHHQTLTARR